MKIFKASKILILLFIFFTGVVRAAEFGSVPSPIVRPDAMNKFWILQEDMTYEVGNTGVYITVPAGFVTDYASIPKAFWSIGLSPHGKYSRASIIHDYLYWTQGCRKEQADRLLLIAMKESEVGSFDEAVIYQGVSKGGKKSWNENAVERKRQLPRVVPVNYRKPKPELTWEQIRTELVVQRVVDPTFPSKPAYCEYGNSTKVPLIAGVPKPQPKNIAPSRVEIATR